MNTIRVAILYGRIEKDAGSDELDIMNEIALVEGALKELGYESVRIALSLDLGETADALAAYRPTLVFNLVESIGGKDNLLGVAPMLLDAIGMPYTGCPTESIQITTNKVIAKNIFTLCGLPTPSWFVPPVSHANAPVAPPFPPPYIVKSQAEHASKLLDDRSVVYDSSLTGLAGAFKSEQMFVEQYVDGREFNIALLGGRDGAETLPVQEIVFVDFPQDKPKIVGYDAKWRGDSFEYRNTRRTFDLKSDDAPVVAKMKTISQYCWNALALRGYARCDFRVDALGNPWLLEVNANPCISPDSGFIAAGERAGLSRTKIIERIIDDTLHSQKRTINLRSHEK